MKGKQRGRITSDQKGHIARPIPTSETKSQHEASRLEPQGRLETERVKSCNARMNVSTYNTRTLRTDDDTNRLIEELGNIKWHVVGLRETKGRREGHRQLSEGRGWEWGSWMCEIGKTEENPNAKELERTLLIIKKSFPKTQTELFHVTLNCRGEHHDTLNKFIPLQATMMMK